MKFLNKKIGAAMIALLLATLACSSANPGSDAVPTSGPDIIPPSPVPSAVSSGPLYQDSFSNRHQDWGTGTDEQSSVEYLNDGLHMAVYQTKYITWSTPGMEMFENTHLAVKVVNNSTDPTAFFGFVCNELGTTSSFYYVGVSPDGYYAFIKSAVAQDDVYLKEGNSDVIAATQGNMNLSMDCGNGSLALYVNEQKIDSVNDTTYEKGSIGLFAASNDIESGVDVTFDDFVVTKLGE